MEVDCHLTSFRFPNLEAETTESCWNIFTLFYDCLLKKDTATNLSFFSSKQRHVRLWQQAGQSIKPSCTTHHQSQITTW